ncbi:GAF and ANTAR domain-containing protein [Rhodococcoides fascians]|uniref:GAF and ANTAR domain-containing protein n=1 Tax=Rhodococcoides fascians TaxID=1828 RepID=UPI00050C7E59|nr:GAF and ANTAR domain-containing protein [Rhodococcus fascians]
MNDVSQHDSPSTDPATVFAALADIVYRGSSAEAIYTAICNAAVLIVPHCDHASLMLMRHGKPVTVAASDDIARVVDDIERATGEGPCLDAITSEAAQLEADFRTPTQWPAMARGVLNRTPVRGAMGFRVKVDDQKVGALNLFTDQPGVFDTDSASKAIILTAFTAVTVAAVMNGQEASTLRDGLESNREIGKAIGLIMALHDVSGDEAFALLRKSSQDLNVKIADLAASVVDRHSKGLTS